MLLNRRLSEFAPGAVRRNGASVLPAIAVLALTLAGCVKELAGPQDGPEDPAPSDGSHLSLTLGADEKTGTKASGPLVSVKDTLRLEDSSVEALGTVALDLVSEPWPVPESVTYLPQTRGMVIGSNGDLAASEDHAAITFSISMRSSGSSGGYSLLFNNQTLSRMYGRTYESDEEYNLRGEGTDFFFELFTPASEGTLTEDASHFPSADSKITLQASPGTDVQEQKDLLVKTKTVEGSSENITGFSVEMDHAYAQVKVRATDDCPDCVIKSVSLVNVVSSGYYNFSSGSWVLGPSKTDYSVTVNKTVSGGTPCDVTDGDDVFFVIPQTGAADAALKIVMNYLGADHTIYFTAAGHEWEQGAIAVYNLSFPSITTQYSITFNPTSATVLSDAGSYEASFTTNAPTSDASAWDVMWSPGFEEGTALSISPSEGKVYYSLAANNTVETKTYKFFAQYSNKFKDVLSNIFTVTQPGLSPTITDISPAEESWAYSETDTREFVITGTNLDMVTVGLSLEDVSSHWTVSGVTVESPTRATFTATPNAKAASSGGYTMYITPTLSAGTVSDGVKATLTHVKRNPSFDALTAALSWPYDGDETKNAVITGSDIELSDISTNASSLSHFDVSVDSVDEIHITPKGYNDTGADFVEDLDVTIFGVTRTVTLTQSRQAGSFTWLYPAWIRWDYDDTEPYDALFGGTAIFVSDIRLGSLTHFTAIPGDYRIYIAPVGENNTDTDYEETLTVTIFGVEKEILLTQLHRVPVFTELAPTSFEWNWDDDSSDRKYSVVSGTDLAISDFELGSLTHFSAQMYQSGGDISVCVWPKGNNTTSADYEETLTITVNGTSRTISLTQYAGRKIVSTETEYEEPVLTVGEIGDVPASGGTSEAPACSFTQRARTVTHYADGTSSTGDWYDLSEPAGTYCYCKTQYGTYSSVHSGYTGQNLGTQEKARTKLGDMYVYVIANGKQSGKESRSVYQEANVKTPGALTVSLDYDSPVPAVSGSEYPTCSSYSLVRTYTSGAGETVTTGGTVTYSVSGTGFSVAQDGNLSWTENTSAQARSCTVTMTVTLDGRTKSCSRAVSQNAATISHELVVSPSSLSLTAGGSGSLTATYYTTVNGVTDSGTDVTSSAIWSSGNTSVATVSAGSVTAVGTGVTTVTASYGGYQGQCSVTVSEAEDEYDIIIYKD